LTGAVYAATAGTALAGWPTTTHTGAVVTVGSGNVVTQIAASATGGAVTQYLGTVSGGSGSQTPWTNTVNAAGYALTNLLTVAWSNGPSISCTSTSITFSIGTNSYVMP
jgi:hypothetical protein